VDCSLLVGLCDMHVDCSLLVGLCDMYVDCHSVIDFGRFMIRKLKRWNSKT
jgi:hypothetical protein